MDTSREEIARIRNKHDEARLDLRIPPHECVFQGKRRTNADQDSNEQTSEENKQEDTDSFEETDDAEIGYLSSLVTLRGLEKHDGDSVVQDRLPKDNCI